MLKRASWMKFAPNRWTGIGGKIESNENFSQSALRELLEETTIKSTDISGFREIANITFKGSPVGDWPNGYRIVYYDAIYPHENLPPCNEGLLQWVDISQLSTIDIIEDTKAALKVFTQKVFGKNLVRPLVGEFFEDIPHQRNRVVFH